MRCGIGYLGEINGIDWVSDRTGVPAAWRESVSEDGELVVRIALVPGEDVHAEASLNGKTVRYDAVREPPPACAG